MPANVLQDPFSYQGGRGLPSRLPRCFGRTLTPSRSFRGPPSLWDVGWHLPAHHRALTFMLPVDDTPSRAFTPPPILPLNLWTTLVRTLCTTVDIIRTQVNPSVLVGYAPTTTTHGPVYDLLASVFHSINSSRLLLTRRFSTTQTRQRSQPGRGIFSSVS